MAHHIGTTQGQARHLGRKWTNVAVKGCKWIGGAKRTNRRIRVPASAWPCTIEEKLTLGRWMAKGGKVRDEDG